MISVATNMLIKEGLFVFWKATTPRLVRLTVSTCTCLFSLDKELANSVQQLSSSITFMVYDYTLNLFDILSSKQNRIDAI